MNEIERIEIDEYDIDPILTYQTFRNNNRNNLKHRKNNRIASKMKKTKILLTLIIGSIVIVGLSYILANYRLISGVGESMEPAMTDGVYICQYNTTIDINDIIAFDIGGIKIVHRIVGISKDSLGITYYTTNGDGNDLVDNFIITDTNIICEIK